jgi:VIT1/CCC1 family predicted Fe2+/Mn2+ transporter
MREGGAEVKKMNRQRIAIILGSADGLGLSVSEIASLLHHQPAIFHAGLGAGLGEFVSMGAALWLSTDPADEAGFWPAAACGIASLLGCLLPVLPYAFISGTAALVAAALIAVAVGAVISWLRPERGLLAISETYGVLMAAGLLCWAAALI